MKNLIKYKYPIVIILAITLFFTYSFATAKDNTDSSDNVVQILYPYVEGLMNSSEKSRIGLRSLEEMVDAYNIVDSNPYKIKLMKIEAASYGEYVSKRNSLFFSDQQPDLIYVVNYYNEGVYATVDPAEYINNGIALKVDDKLENYDNLYDFLKDPYYIPTGYRQIVQPFLTTTMNEMGIEDIPYIVEPEMKTDFMRQWINLRQPTLDAIVYDQLLETYFPISLFYNNDDKVIEMQRDQVIDHLNEIRTFINDGTLDLDLMNTPEDTLMLIRNPIGEAREDLIDRFWSFEYYLLDSSSMENLGCPSIRPQNTRFNQQYFIEPGLIESTGFVFNRKGGDLEGAYAFVDYSISNRIQEIYMGDRVPAYNGPVVKTIPTSDMKKAWIKDRVVDSEGMAMWQTYTDFVDDGGSIVMGNNQLLLNEFYFSFLDIVPEYIFDSSYTEAELENDLRRLENAYIFRLME